MAPCGENAIANGHAEQKPAAATYVPTGEGVAGGTVADADGRSDE